MAEPKGFDVLGGKSLEDYTSGMTKKQFMSTVTKLKKQGEKVNLRNVESVYNSRYAKDEKVSPMKKGIKNILNMFSTKPKENTSTEKKMKIEIEVALPKSRPKKLKKNMGGMLKKPEMAYGGSVSGKKHMYAGGGSVTDNVGLRALKKASPMAYSKIKG